MLIVDILILSIWLVYIALVFSADASSEFGCVVKGDVYVRFNKERQILLHPWMIAFGFCVLLWPHISTPMRILLGLIGLYDFICGKPFEGEMFRPFEALPITHE